MSMKHGLQDTTDRQPNHPSTGKGIEGAWVALKEFRRSIPEHLVDEEMFPLVFSA